MRRIFVLLALTISIPSSAESMVGGASLATPATGSHHVVMLVGSRGNVCSAVAIARDLVLTAAHCVTPGAEYRIRGDGPAGRPTFKAISAIARHPQFSPSAYAASRATADLALAKLAEPLAGNIAPAALSAGGASARPGDRFLVTGYGLAHSSDHRSIGTLRAASLAATGRPGGLQLRLFDPQTRNERPGLGACTGDSGAPVFGGAGGRLTVIGVVSWSTGAQNATGCGGLTGVTPLTRYRSWIVETARKLGASAILAP